MNIIDFYKHFEEATGEVGAFYEEIVDVAVKNAVSNNYLHTFDEISAVSNIWYEAIRSMRKGDRLFWIDTDLISNEVKSAIIDVAEELNVYIDTMADYDCKHFELDFSEEYVG